MTSQAPQASIVALSHALSGAEVAAQLGVAPEHGLDDAQAAERLASCGPNRTSSRPGRGALVRFLDQIRQPLVLVLVASGTITALLGESLDSLVIFGVVLVNAAAGFVQEGKATAALAALARTLAAQATVLRQGRQRRVDAADLVPGDIVMLAAGDKVPADLRLLAASELRVIEAALTGESLPVSKQTAPLASDTALAERSNLTYAGTTVVGGQGRGIVVATGAATETGRIALLIATTPDLDTPLTRKMAAFAQRMLWIILALALLTFGVGMARGASAVDMFMAAVALAVGAIPEGLPAAITITLAIGVGRMAKRRAIVRQLPAVEALGSTTVICADKTGTLTTNEMTVRELFAGATHYAVTGTGYAPTGEIRGAASPALRAMLSAGVLCNDAALHCADDRWQISGDPTEAALLVAAAKGGIAIDALRQQQPRRAELPFDAQRQSMATLHAVGEQTLIYVKGAVEKLLPACDRMLAATGDAVAIDAALIDTAAAAMTRSGLRVLLLAQVQAVGAEPLAHSVASRSLCFLGLAGMADPPRREAIAAVRACHGAGIRVVMISGDHLETACAIARQVGIASERGAALSGRDLAALDDAALRRALATTEVFARVEPAQKLRLVKALQAAGEIVAMTGDGVNDAPALQQADIGIAMGGSGTEVAKEAAAMVLTDDNFATIEAAIEEGRGVYDNLLKFVTWTLPTNFGEGLVILAAVLAGVALPITPLQILWINMTTAVLLGLPLAFEPIEGDVMTRPPRPPRQPIFDRALAARIAFVGILLLAGAFGLFALSLQRGLDIATARTIAANVFVMSELLYLFNCRSLTRSIFALPPFSNPWVWGCSAIMIVLQLSFTYLPFMNRLFGTAAIGFDAWLEILAVATASMLLVEAEKALRARARGS